MYTLAGTTFILSLLLDRLDVETKLRFICCFSLPAVSVSVSDSWFGEVVLFFLNWEPYLLACKPIRLMYKQIWTD